VVWLAGLFGQALVIVLLLLGGAVAWLPALLLLIPLPWLLRRSEYAHAVNCLLILMYAGGGLVFADTRTGIPIACIAAAVFVCNMLFVRFSARDRALAN
jgi:uncharacterized membrane protein